MNNIFKIFLAPSECKKLRDLGITSDTFFKWRRNYDNGWYLFSNNLDYLGMYSDDMLPSNVSMAQEDELPAYGISSLMHSVPGLWLSENNGKFTFSTDKQYCAEPVEHLDMGVGLSLMLQQLIKAKKLTASKIKL